MKKPYIPLLFLLMLFNVKCFCQVKPEFAPIGATWYYQNQLGIQGNYFGYSTFTSIDTATILGNACKIISNGTNYYFYEDSLHMYYLNAQNKWAVLADFQKQVGDSFYVNTGDTTASVNDSITVIIIAKGDTIINGYSLPYIVTMDDYHTGAGSILAYAGKIIKNIGSDQYLIPTAAVADPGPGPLRCYSDSNLGLYKNPLFNNGSWPCDTVYSYNSTIDVKLKTEDINIFPNPSHDEINIEMSGNIIPNEINITDALGRIWERIIPKQTLTELNIEELSQGIYFIRIQTANAVEVRKVVKE